MQETLIHRRVREAREGRNPGVICRVRSGWVVLGDRQDLRGYSLLLSDPVVETMNHLTPEQRLIFLDDMTRLGDALLEVTGARLINYSILGNTDRALHAHVHPRYADERPDRIGGPPFAYHADPPVPFDLPRGKPLMDAICASLKRLGATI